MSIFLNRHHNFVFGHMPKTGGSSIRGHRSSHTSGLFPFHQWSGRVTNPDRVPRDWPMERSFIFVRHPIERFLSAVRYTGHDTPMDRLREIMEDPDLDPNDLTSPVTHLLHHIVPQTHPMHGLDRFTHVGRFEDFENELRRILGLLEVNPPNIGEIPHVNRSRRPVPFEISADDAEFLSGYYAQDFEVLGYEPMTVSHS